MTINTSQIRQLLRPGLKEVFGLYQDYPAMWTEMFTKHTSDMAFELEVEMKMLGQASLLAEGAPTAMQDMGERVISKYVHRYVSVGFTITRQAQKDNLYKSRFPLMAENLKHSMLAAKETLAASVPLNGWNTNFPGGDGKPLFDTAHPIEYGTYANTFAVSAELNEASLESAIVAVQQYRDWAGVFAKTMPKKLIVGPSLQFTINRLLNSEFRTQTPNNDINPINHSNYIPEGYRVNQYLSSMPGIWLMLTSSPNALKCYQREELETDVYQDFQNSNLLCKAIERYSFGWSNPRGVFASGN